MKDYDAVVVGAGLGGLSAAASLAVEGKKVLLLERHNVPGGYASTFTRGRFEFEVSLHELSGLGHAERRGPLYKRLQYLDVAHRVEFLDIPDFYRSVFPDLDIVVPCDRQGWEEVLCSHFPKDREGIKRFTEIMFGIEEEVDRLSREGTEAMAKEPSSFSHLLTYLNSTLAEVLDREVSDQRARAVIAQLWGYYGQPPSRLSLLLFAVAHATYLKYGPVHVKGKSQALSQAFVDSIEEHGGEVWFNNGVSRILVEEGKVQGVVTDDGSEILSPYVICNVNPITTCLDLIGREKIPSWYLRRLGWGEIGTSLFCVFMGLDCSCDELGLHNHEIALNTSYDMEKPYQMARTSLDYEPSMVVMTPYNVVDPDFSPPGTTNLVLAKLTYGDLWTRLSPAEYIDTKNRLASRLIAMAENAAPGITRHVEEVEVSTPLTNMHFTGNVDGAVYGYVNTPQEAAIMRLPNRGALEGLYFANAWMRLGGGFQPCIDSGYTAAQEALEDMERGGRDPVVMETLKSTMESQSGSAEEIKLEPLHVEKVVARLHPRRLSLRVDQVIEETASAKTFRMIPQNGEVPYFRAGQYVNLFVEIDGVLTSRPYSIASPPGKPYFDLTVRRVEKGFVSHFLLDRVKPGDTFQCTGPSGSFYYEPLRDSTDLVFLAGGSGITPFASMIREAAERKLPINIHLIYGSRDPGDIIFAQELEELEKGSANIKVDLVISEPPEEWEGLCGLLDADMIIERVGSVEGKTFFICGPTPMYAFCEEALEVLGVPRKSIRKEAYGPPEDITQDPGWPGLDADSEFEVVEERSGARVKARAGEPLMVSLERGGVVVPAVCRSGECSACRTRLLSGKVFTPERVKLRWSDQQAGYIHPCMSYPLGDLRIRI